MSRPEDQIVFEDLHGTQEEKAVTVDLDANLKDAGIETAPVDQAVESDAKDDDRVEFDNLRSAQVDDDDESDTKKADQQDDKDDAASKAGAEDEYSKKVKARIERERRVTRKERTRADYWESQARQLAKDQYETDKKAAERTIEQAGSAIEQTQADLEKAIEDGDTKGQVRLTTRLTDLKAEKIQAEVSLDNLSPDGNVQPFDDKVSPKGEKSDASLAKDWMDDRGDWYGAKGFERQTRLANRLDKEVFKDGYDPKTPEYFEELDRRIKEREPSLYEDLDATDDKTDDKDDDTQTQTRKGQQVVAPVGGNETRRQRTSGSKVELGPDDFANMREFGLDPNDPEVLKEYARNKAEAEGARR